MNIEESIEQIETLIDAWELDEAELNQTDINAMQVLLKENQELKEKLDKYENPEDMTLMMMWCTEKVKDQNEKLKKQLENANEKIILLQASEPMLNYKKALEETQQEKFIKWLEGEIILCKNRPAYTVTDILGSYDLSKIELEFFEKVVKKYKEIIGE